MATRATATATAMATMWVMAIATRLVGNKEGKVESNKGNYNSNEGGRQGRGQGRQGNGDGDKGGGKQMVTATKRVMATKMREGGEEEGNGKGG